jgi:phosphoserine phosphatase
VSSDHKKKIAVFDLDGTLLKGDSLRALALRRIPVCPQIIHAAIRRKFLNKSRADFAERLHTAMREVFACPEELKKIIHRFAGQISYERFSVVQKWQQQGAKTILLSASPHDYVCPLAKRIAMNYGFGSHWSGDTYRHLFAKEKLLFLNSHFPKNLWEWSYAMSDSISDQPLLAMFEQHDLVDSL